MKRTKPSSGAARRPAGRAKGGRAKTGAARPRTARAVRAVVVVPDPSAPAARGIDVIVPAPGAGDAGATAAEAARQVKTLEEHGNISRSSGVLGPGQTHAIETSRGGRRKLVRKRFSAT